MTLPPVVSKEEWLAARKELLAKEKEVTRARDAVNAKRRELPIVRMEKEYVFEGPALGERTGEKHSLLDLFDGRRQLIVYHFMWRYDLDAGCPSCSLLVDSIPHLAHLHAANTSLVLVSRAPLEDIAKFQRRMGWTTPWYSSYGSDFNYDFHVTLDPDVAPVEYNYEPARKGWTGEAPGVSVFLREGDEVYHTYSSYARGGDILLNVFNFLDLTPLGRQEDAGIMSWIRHHDSYEPAKPS